MKSPLLRVIVSAVAILIIVWLGFVMFFVNPTNYRMDLDPLSWSRALTNGAILVLVISGIRMALRRIWSTKKELDPRLAEKEDALKKRANEGEL